MHPAMEGALIGLALGALLVGYEYYAVKKEVEERAAARHLKPRFEPQDKNRVMSVLRFAIFLPPGGAVLFWLWNMMG
jgi:hypothetical protein